MTARAALVLALLALAAAPARAQDDPTGSFEEESRRYEEGRARKALYLRALSAERFARTRDERALRALLRRYVQPEAPEDHVRYLMAGLAGDLFEGAEHVAAFQEATKRAAEAPDAWLWFQALALEARHGGVEAVAAVAVDPKRDPFVRAAALEVLGAGEDRADAALATIARVLGPPAGAKLKGVERAALVEACAWTLAGHGARGGTPPFAEAAGHVIDALDGKKTELRTKLVVARALARALRADALYLDAESWRRVLAGRAAEAEAQAQGDASRVRVAGGGVTAPRFFGIEGAGLRVVFVVDLSDSMLTPLTREEVEELRRPRTGDAPTAERGAPPAPPAPGDELPWDRIKTRFDVARETLRRSLLALGDKMSFGVVVFGTKARPLLAPNLLRATPQNVQRTLAALDALKPGKAEAGREHGTLEGYTNLHGGLRLAWRLTEAAPIAAHEHVAAPGFDTGADTVFLLSDGAPSWDDYDQEDVSVEGMTSGDPETGEETGDVPELHYYGPYVETRFLLRDVERMNLFRRVELHCVGIGEATPELLRALTELGRGQLRTIGGR